MIIIMIMILHLLQVGFDERKKQCEILTTEMKEAKQLPVQGY